MAWPGPNEGKVRCIGFPDNWLPVIKNAIDHKKVTWGKSVLFCQSGSAEFEWADCTWILEEMNECVRSIELKHGAPNSQDLTAAVLKG